jgi:hypothetical protein
MRQRDKFREMSMMTYRSKRMSAAVYVTNPVAPEVQPLQLGQLGDVGLALASAK